MVERIEASFVTTTAYGSWLPGDVRGYVELGQILPGSPPLARFARSRLKEPPVAFNDSEQAKLFDALVDAALEYAYRLSDAAIESTHLHWIIGHDDAMNVMVGRLKSRLRQRLDRGRIWTAGYCGFELRSLKALEQAREYIAHHPGARMIAGRAITRP